MDLELREALALSDDRHAARAQLLPGSEDHDYYRALHAQHAGQLDEADAIIAAWPARHGQTSAYTRLQLRQLLCRAAVQPALAAPHLRDWFGVHHRHEAAAEDVDPTRPTRLAAGAFDGAALLTQAMQADADLSRVTDEGLLELVDIELDAGRRRSLLARLHHTPNPNLVAHVIAELGTRGTPGFGQLGVHGQLTLDQLRAVGAARPELAGHLSWVFAVICRLRPHHTVNLDLDREARHAYLQTLWAEVAALPPSTNSLKAHVLWHLLDVQRRRDTVDPALVRAYLALPRLAPYVATVFEREDRAALAQLGSDFRQVTGLGPAGDDEALVRDLLQRDLAHAEQYARWLDRAWFELEVAAAALLAGTPEADRATLALGPARAAALRDRVELTWSAGNAAYFAADAEVALDAELKNVPALTVKVFRIDPVAYFHHHKREVNTDLDLDGLAASHEWVLQQSEPPVRRVRRRIELPMCARPGTYVIDLVGNGRSSRALVHKGRLRHVTRVGAAGHVVTILDEAGAIRADARAHVNEREYVPDAQGAIVIPFSTAPGRTPILLVAEDLASVGHVELVRETYHLALDLIVDREALAAGRTVTAIARLALTVAGMPASLALLQRTTWDVTITDRHGVTTTKSQPLALDDQGAAVIEWPLPDDAAHVALSVRGTVTVRSEQREQELVDARAFALATIHATDSIEALYLADTAAGWVVSALGKSGEPRASRPVAIALVHRWARWQLDAELGTDAAGRIELGALPGVEWISATLGGHTQQWLAGDVGIGATLFVPAGAEVRVPLPPRRTADEVIRRMSLVELRGGAPARHPTVEIEALASALVLRGLPPGEYELRAPGVHAAITVAGEGPLVTGCTIAAGEILQTPRALPALATVEAAAGGDLVIATHGATARTRIHVIATRFISALVEPPALGPAQVPQRRADPARGTYYVSGRELGDEYRYVLERRGQRAYPSLLLDKPSLLLNPWSRRTTTTDIATAAKGGAFGAAAPKAARAMAGYGARQDRATADDALAFASYDFVPAPPAVLANLAPDETGRLVIPAAALGDATTVTVILDDPAGVARRHAARAEQPLAPRDLRLRVALDPARHAQQQRRVAPLVAGERLVIEDLATAKVHLVDSIERAHGYLLALRDDATLREFAFVTRWHALAESEQRERYSKYACHELHLFLYFKDRPFFDAVVAPYLAHKHTPTFLDRWLLGADLSADLEPARLAKLNAVERALLARRLPAAAALVRILEDQVSLAPPDPATEARLIDALLGASALDGDDEVNVAQSAAYASADLAAEEATGGYPAPMMETMAMARRGGGGERMAKLAGPRLRSAVHDDGDDFDDLGGDVARRAEPIAAHYRAVDRTQEWAEHNWWRRTPAESGPEMIAPNRLWRDLARHPGGPFLSPWLGLATGSFAEAMCALAVIDLPPVAPKHRYESTSGPRGAGLAITVAANALGGSAQLVDGALVTTGAPLVVGTSYVRADDRTEWESGEQRDKYVEAFATGVVYTCLVVLANPTSSRQRVSALVQIPRGSIAVGGARTTQTIDVVLPPYGTHGHEYSFYFPAPGAWGHFPVHASRGEAIVAAAPPRVLDVTAGAAIQDPTAWSHVSQRGSLAEVVAYLDTKNLAAIDLALVAWRLRERPAYELILAALERRRVYRDELWGYSLLHADAPRMLAWLRAQDARLLEAGPSLDMLALDSEDLGAYEHLELSPLVNARAHRLGARLRILNDGLAQQYDRFLDLVAHRPQPLPKDRLAAATYLLAQDRVEAALAMLARVDAATVPERMQYDYLAAYAACLTGEVAAARARIAPWLDHPVDRWRHRFGAMQAMLDEVGGAAPAVVDAQSREQQQGARAAQQPTFDLALDRQGVTLASQHVAAIELRFFEMDVELLFSRQPFVQSDASRFSFIEPGHRERVVSPPPDVTIPWPAALRGKHVVVEAVAAGLRKAKVHYANDLTVTLANQQGQLRVARAADRTALPATYVKVYARLHGGAVEFYKDGYTDLRGWFDYATLSTDQLDRVERFAILVASDVAGASIVETAPPGR